jgi:hypothetical protein
MLNFLVETKQEYTTQLTNILTPLILEGLNSIYTEVLGISKPENILKHFQCFLKRVPKWNIDIIEKETMRIMNNTKSYSWLEDLIKATLKANIVVLTYNPSIKNQIKLDASLYKNIKINDFIHKIYIECAREIWNNPYLFYHLYPPIELKRNQRDTIVLIKDCIKEAIRKLLPVNHILKIYLGEEIEYSEQDFEQVLTEGEQHNLSKMIKQDLANDYKVDLANDYKVDLANDYKVDLANDYNSDLANDYNSDLANNYKLAQPTLLKNIKQDLSDYTSSTKSPNLSIKKDKNGNIKELVYKEIEGEMQSEELVIKDNPKNLLNSIIEHKTSDVFVTKNNDNTSNKETPKIENTVGSQILNIINDKHLNLSDNNTSSEQNIMSSINSILDKKNDSETSFNTKQGKDAFHEMFSNSILEEDIINKQPIQKKTSFFNKYLTIPNK